MNDDRNEFVLPAIILAILGVVMHQLYDMNKSTGALQSKLGDGIKATNELKRELDEGVKAIGELQKVLRQTEIDALSDKMKELNEVTPTLLKSVTVVNARLGDPKSPPNDSLLGRLNALNASNGTSLVTISTQLGTLKGHLSTLNGTTDGLPKFSDNAKPLTQDGGLLAQLLNKDSGLPAVVDKTNTLLGTTGIAAIGTRIDTLYTGTSDSPSALARLIKDLGIIAAGSGKVTALQDAVKQAEWAQLQTISDQCKPINEAPANVVNLIAAIAKMNQDPERQRFIDVGNAAKEIKQLLVEVDKVAQDQSKLKLALDQLKGLCTQPEKTVQTTGTPN